MNKRDTKGKLIWIKGKCKSRGKRRRSRKQKTEEEETEKGDQKSPKKNH